MNRFQVLLSISTCAATPGIIDGPSAPRRASSGPELEADAVAPVAATRRARPGRAVQVDPMIIHVETAWN